MSRRKARHWLGFLVALPCLCGCPSRVNPNQGLDHALAAAVRALIAAQQPDGSWRSRTYGALKDGPSLTPPILKAVTFAPDQPGSVEARRKGALYLAGLAQELRHGDSSPGRLIYPIYTTSLALLVSTRVLTEDTEIVREFWLAELRARQMTERLGWSRADLAFGAWGYSLTPLRKREGQETGLPLDADLSSTMFALGALRIAGVPAEDPAIRDALVFVERCQNFASETSGDSSMDDGGFFLTPTDPLRNKAGESGRDSRGVMRFHSYGSATADGVRALVRCGLPLDHPRVVAGRRWLERHFSARRHPGKFAPGREIERDGTYYYYVWSAAHAFRALGLDVLEADERRVRWAEGIALELARRQRKDGTWSNPVSSSKEDDPLVATSLAVGALGICRAAIPL